MSVKHRFLAIGIPNLPNNINTISWAEALQKKVNITDYGVIFIDFSSCPLFIDYFSNKEEEILRQKFSQLLNERKFNEVVWGDIQLFLFVNDRTSFNWFTKCVDIRILKESGKHKEMNLMEYQDYFNLLSEWDFCFTAANKPHHKPYLRFDIIPIATNRAKNFLGVLFTNFQSYVGPFKGLLGQGFNKDIRAEHPGKIVILPTLKENSYKGVLSILNNLFKISFVKEEPGWSKNIKFQKSIKIEKRIKELKKRKNELNEGIAKEIYELEKINKFKKLLWGTRRELEKIVYEVFKELLSIDISEPTKSEEDGIFKYNQSVFVIEIKSGERRGAKFTELTKLVTRMENVKKKFPTKAVEGIFIMNHYADLLLKERKVAFPDNVIKTADVNNIRLLTTPELFEIVRNIIDKKIDKKTALKKIIKK